MSEMARGSGAPPSLLLPLLLLGQLCGAAAQCQCPDGSAPRSTMPPCSGGPPTGAGCPSPGAPGGGGGVNSYPSSYSTPAGCSLLGDVGRTSVPGSDARSGDTFPVGENIYGPFEAGFASQQDSRLESLGCAQGSLGHVAGGIDTQTAEQMVAAQCSITLPRCGDGSPNAASCPSSTTYISLLDECGGHTNDYHFHERLDCLYSHTQGSGHSTRVGFAMDGTTGLYGKWESFATSTRPALDACGGHFGVTPDSSGASVYHHHVQVRAWTSPPHAGDT
jgi:hypothetical protein